MKRILLVVLSLVFHLVSFGQSACDTLAGYFQELEAVTGKAIDFWGHDLYAPILLVDAQSRQVWANRPDSGGLLRNEGRCYSGRLPSSQNTANTALDWSGTRWAMVLLPLPTDRAERIALLTHELFHRLQPSLGFALNNPENAHLDTEEGRIWLRLELGALRTALYRSGAARRRAVGDALLFRARRRALFPATGASESALELNEGLAQYTGLVLSGRSGKATVEHLDSSLSRFLRSPGYVRSFAYQTLPVYGWLLRDSRRRWHLDLREGASVDSFLNRAFKTPQRVLDPAFAESRSATYGAARIRQEEAARAARNRQVLAAYRRRFVEGPHLSIRFEAINISFDPSSLVVLEDKGTVYPTIRVSDKWGILTVSAGGALLAPDWSGITVSAPTSADGLLGDGWTLELASGYALEREGGNFIIRKR